MRVEAKQVRKHAAGARVGGVDNVPALRREEIYHAHRHRGFELTENMTDLPPGQDGVRDVLNLSDGPSRIPDIGSADASGKEESSFLHT